MTFGFLVLAIVALTFAILLLMKRIRNLEARVFENDNSIQLSKRDSEALAKMLLEPAPEPTEALKRAARDYLANKSYGGTD